jgi:hypothetical protein
MHNSLPRAAAAQWLLRLVLGGVRRRCDVIKRHERADQSQHEKDFDFHVRLSCCETAGSGVSVSKKRS